MNKYEALNALAEIRDYLRGLDANKEIPILIVDDFNIVARKLGAADHWCKQKLTSDAS